MKLENEHVLGVQTPPRKSYNPFDSDDDIEASNGYLKSNVGYDIKRFETNDDSLTFHLDSSDLSWEEAILNHSQVLSRTTPADSNGEEVLLRKDSELFTDKTVTECDLPELMVCYKENAYQSVKDIGIDEGMPLHDKVSIKSRDDDGSVDSHAFLDLNGDSKGSLPVGDEHRELPFMEGMKSRTEDYSDKDFSSQTWAQDSLKYRVAEVEDLERRKSSNQCGIDDSTKVDELKLNSSKEESTSSLEFRDDPGKNGSVVDCTSDSQLNKTDEASCHKPQQKENEVSEEKHGEDHVSLGSRESSTMPSGGLRNGASTVSSESPSEEATSQSVGLSESEEPTDESVTNGLSYNSKVECGSIILDFNSSTEEGKDEKEETTQQNKAVAKPPEAQSMSRDEEASPGSITESGTDDRVHGETSFSAAVPTPASITYMGPYGRCGSISLRSESSAGSTRSFAFPVLQAEWNSSPVRMTKAEQRHFRKSRGWVHQLMCCKF